MIKLYISAAGEDAVKLAVDHFYERVLADSSLQHFFSGVSMGG